MSSSSIDYNSLLSSDPPFGLPYDVTFLIFDEKKEKQGEVPSHKFIFAVNSPVFKSRFTGSGNFAGKNDEDGQVKITGTLEAFQLVTRFLYNKPTAIGELSVDKIFDVVDLAHCYQIGKLEEALEQRLEKFVIAKDDVIEVAKKAEEFGRFAMASQALLKSCARTLQKALNDAKEFIEFCSQVAGTGDEAVCFRLFAMIKDLQPLQPLARPGLAVFQAGAAREPGRTAAVSQWRGRDTPGRSRVSATVSSPYFSTSPFSLADEFFADTAPSLRERLEGVDRGDCPMCGREMLTSRLQQHASQCQ